MTTVTVNKLRGHLLAAANDGVPAYAVAAACGIHPSELSRFACGDPISQKHLLTLADYFGVDPNELLGTYEVEVG